MQKVYVITIVPCYCLRPSTSSHTSKLQLGVAKVNPPCLWDPGKGQRFNNNVNIVEEGGTLCSMRPC